MKKLYSTFLFFALAAGVLQAQLTPELMYYRFNGAGTSVPNEASSPVGSANATIMGGVTQGPGATQLCGGSLIGSGITSTTDYLNTGWAPNLGNGSWSIVFRASGISTNATLYYIFGDANTNSLRCFTNGIAGSTNWVLRGGGLTDTYINGGALSTPTMCAFVYDNALNNVKGYLNGVLVTTVAQGAPNLTGTGPFKVMGYGTNVGAPAGGQLDEFRLYNRALSAAEVTQLYNPFAAGDFLGSDPAFCSGDSAALDLGWPWSSVLWSTGATTNPIYANTSGQYYATVSGACGAGSDTVTVTASPAPTPSISGSLVICSGNSTTLDAGSGFSSYLWTTADTTQTVVANSAGTYGVMVTDSIGCSGADTVTVNAFASPTVNLGSDIIICQNDTVLLDAGAGYTSYDWTTLDSVQSIFASNAGMYGVTVQDSNGCSGSDSINISVNPLPVVSAGADTSYCEGSSVVLDAGAGFVTYTWSNLATTQTTTVNTAGTYTVVVSDSNGCEGSDAVDVAEDPLPVASFTDSPSGFTVTFTNTSTNGTTYAWDFGDGNTSTSTSPSNTYATAGTYTVTLIATNDCGSDTTSTTFTLSSVAGSLAFSSFSMAPNPTSGSVTILAEMNNTSNLEVSVLSLNGQLIRSEKPATSNGSLNFSMDLSNLAAGIYFVRLQTTEGFSMHKLVIE